MKRGIIGTLLCVIVAVGCATVVAPEPVTVKWNLQEGTQYIYDYTREIAWKTSTGGNVVNRAKTGKTKETGTVLLVWEKGHTAAQVEVRCKYDPPPKLLEKSPHGVMEEQGTVRYGTNAWRMADPGSLSNQPLPPLPAAPLVPGKILRQEMVCMTPGWPMADGTGEFSYVGRETVDGVPCVHYRVSCKLRNEPKQGKEPRATVKIEAAINALFTLGAGHLVSAEGIIHKRLSRPVKGLSKKTMGTSSITEETQKVSLRLRK